MRHAVVCAVVAFFVVMLQLTFVDRLVLPGGTVPDLALDVVIAFGLTQGPSTGMLAGFFTGLDLDLAPPGSHLIGASALMFCLLGYGCGRLTGKQGQPAALLFAFAVLAAAIGETLQAAISILGDPGVTLLAVRQVLPTAVLYDALLTPAVLALVTLAGSARLRRWWSEHKPGSEPTSQPPARLAASTRIPVAVFRSGSAQRGSAQRGPAKRGGSQPGHRDRPIRLHMSAARRRGAQPGHRDRPVRLHMSAARRRGRINRSGGSR